MLERLIEAAGLQRPSVVVKKRRDDILAVIRDAGGTMPRVFGSCARGDDTALSDLDLFITPTQGNAWKFVGIASRLSELLGIKVDVIDGRTTNPRLAQAQQEAVAL
jgi:predicted nucleotidyltransferase